VNTPLTSSGLNQGGITQIDVDLPIVNYKRSYPNINLISPQIENVIEPNNEGIHFVTCLFLF
jgi:hypothetical protein